MKYDKMNTMQSDQLLVRVSKAADMLDISKSTLYSLINEGTVPAIRVGKSLRIPIDWLYKWVADQHTESN
ncbi:MAG: helix-turn-helix domain-containing protein [Candidatus Binataceae bacterium]